jgi:hypothetical protein
MSVLGKYDLITLGPNIQSHPLHHLKRMILYGKNILGVNAQIFENDVFVFGKATFRF